jgi:hypothetical protein
MTITREIFEKAINNAKVIDPGIHKVDVDKVLEQLSSAVVKTIFDGRLSTATILAKLNKLADIQLKRMNLEREEGEPEYTADDLDDDIDLIARMIMQEAVNKFGEICSFVKDASAIDIDAIAEYVCEWMFGVHGWLDSEIIRCKESLAEAIASSDVSCLAQGNA